MNKLFAAVLIVSALSLVFCANTVATGSSDVVMEYILTKSSDKASFRDSIKFTISYKKQGYLMLGFGSTKEDSLDYIVGTFNGQTALVEDYTGLGNSNNPVVDKTKDVAVVGAESERNDTSTKFTFTRLLSTGDPLDKRIAVNDDLFLYYAIGDSDDLTQPSVLSGFVNAYVFDAQNVEKDLDKFSSWVSVKITVAVLMIFQLILF